MIDWNAPLEAVHEDGRVVSVELTTWEASNGPQPSPDNCGNYYTTPVEPHRHFGIWRPSGETWVRNSPGWTIRNRRPAIKTAAEQLEGMEAFVRKMADRRDSMHSGDYDEARAIVADLPPVVDADILTARALVATCGKWMYAAKEIREIVPLIQDGTWDHNVCVKSIAEALRRAREEGVK